MKKPFAVGDRVRVFGSSERTDIHGNFYHRGANATVNHLVTDSEIHVLLDGLQSIVVVHPKQCRRLVKKEKPKPRSIWLPKDPARLPADLHKRSVANYNFYLGVNPNNESDWIEFVEKLPKKKGSKK